MSEPNASPDHKAIAELNRMVGELVASGNITDPRWRAAFSAVPRHLFVPRFYRNDEQGSSIVDSASEDDWLSAVYSDIHLVTTEDVRSSSTAPSLMASMLQALGLDGGERVLEIGTGTGYNAALLSERLGSEQVTSVDVDPGLVDQARERLALAGYRPLVTVADGVDGYPEASPYDAVIGTCRLDFVPLAWLRQLQPGGVIVTPLGAGVAVLRKGQTDTEARGHFLPDPAYFMPLRHQPEPEAVGELVELALHGVGVSRAYRCDLSIYRDNDARFWLDLTNPAIRTMTVDGTALAFRSDGAWARLADGVVTQGGPGALWDEVEAAHSAWEEDGRPARGEFRVSITGAGQEVYLADRPERMHRLDPWRR
ncbi:Protein-L-isoaspartate(D-aspartate) O-methyltransferase [Kribbella flavida DSM 17836]|uniref:Protein-L-isoaspartate O-methyltransferase n=1 Tax=Kribbella flavida (strain DSM 17836 / JCM 10339 / NBRC 14399) TaxID=479435 RepID=D2PXC6_KRIFD|nr:methyltransferase domain-containing protein [Kribbella flavida]ADB29774.1 Protein-L-isoaspartate(D-aspartate) O-methyltransferase [Kribbella flavida DSM 17836]